MARVFCLSLVILSVVISAPIAAEPNGSSQAPRANTQAQIDFVGFQSLTLEVQDYRASRLVTLETFQAMAGEPDTIILDARSAEAYRAGHIEGAINLSFTDFTAESLAAAIGDPDTRILIYCNNNFENDAPPVMMKAVELALNIQTFINLYGYGYRNVYELGDVVNFDDPAVRWVRGG
jgi:hypothetical protein